MEQISYHVERKEYPRCAPQRALAIGWKPGRCLCAGGKCVREPEPLPGMIAFNLDAGYWTSITKEQSRKADATLFAIN